MSERWTDTEPKCGYAEGKLERALVAWDYCQLAYKYLLKKV